MFFLQDQIAARRSSPDMSTHALGPLISRLSSNPPTHFLASTIFSPSPRPTLDLATRGTDQAPSTVRTIYSSAWEERCTEAGDILAYRIRGNGFLHHMVRNLVGTMLDVGRGQFNPSDIPASLDARSRSAAGPTAPARGLFLHSVEYS